jgi:hypothetical protein
MRYPGFQASIGWLTLVYAAAAALALHRLRHG